MMIEIVKIATWFHLVPTRICRDAKVTKATCSVHIAVSRLVEMFIRGRIAKGGTLPKNASKRAHLICL